MLLTWNNLSYYQDLMQGMRDAIEAQRFEDFVGGDHREVGEGRPAGALSRGQVLSAFEARRLTPVMR